MEISIQQFQLRTVLKSHKQAMSVLEKIQSTGYHGIELNQFMIEKMPLSIRLLTKLAGFPIGNSGLLDWKLLMKSSKLKVTSLHVSLESLKTRFNAIVEQAKAFKTQRLVITGMRHFAYDDVNKLQELCDDLNSIGKQLFEHHIEFLYHNHNCEFIQTENGKLAYDYIIENTNEAFVHFELDLYWASDAGIEISKLIQKLKHRISLLHINDRCYTPSHKSQSITKFHGCEIGKGTLDYIDVFRLAHQYHVESIIVETHDHWVNDDPIQSLIESYNQIQVILNQSKIEDLTL